MDLNNKIKKILSENNIPDRKSLAEMIGINHVLFSKNVRENRLTGDMIKALSNSNLKINYNWLIIDNYSDEENPEILKKMEKALELLGEIKEELARE